MAGAWLAVASPAVAAPTVVAVEPASSQISVFDTTAAWSSRRADGRYVLRVYQAGIVRTLPVPSRKVPFDVDLGPDRSGRIVAAYSRCDQDGGTLQEGCDLFRYRLGDEETRIKGVSLRGHSEHHPTIWRSRIAFARYRDPATFDAAIFDGLYQRARGRTRRLPRGSLLEPALTAQATRLDLRGRRLAFDWFYLREQCRTPSPYAEQKVDAPRAQSQIWLVDTRGMRRRIATGCSDDQDQVFGATLDRGGLRYQQERAGPPDVFGGTQSSVLRTVNERGMRLATRRLPDAIVASAANDKILVTSRRLVGTPADSADRTYEIAIETR